MPAPTLRLVKGSPLTNAEVDANFNDLYNEKLDKSGGTLSGALTLSGNPTAGLHAASKQYVDNTALLKSGGTMSGVLVLNGNPNATNDAANKGYVDTQVATSLPLAGGTLIGALTLNSDPSVALHAATKQYVDGLSALAVPLSGGTMNGALTLSGNPTANLHATTKQYVDGLIAGRLSTGGGTLTGMLTLQSDPTIALHAATKNYVDTAALLKAGGTMIGALTLAGAPSDGLHAATKAYVDAGVRSVVGSTNRVGASYSGGTVTLTIPQEIATTSALQFGSLGIGAVPSGVAGEIRATNEITAYYASDARLKENLKVLSGALHKVMTLRGVEYDWTAEHIAARGGEDGYFVRKHDVGVIAQELQIVLPEAVATREDGFLAVRYEKIVPLLIEALKEMKAELDSLKASN